MAALDNVFGVRAILSSGLKRVFRNKWNFDGDYWDIDDEDDGEGKKRTRIRLKLDELGSDGDVLSPGGTVTDGAIAAFDGTAGKKLKQLAIAANDLVYGIVDDARRYAVQLTGLTDNTLAFQNAVSTAAASTSRLIVPKGTVRIDGTIQLPNDFELVLLPGATIDMSHAPAQTIAFSALGSEASSQNLTGNVAKGATVLPVTTGSAYVRGDLLRLFSDKVFDASNTNSEIGELVRVASVSGNNVTIETATQAAYATADTARVSKITPAKNIRISGGGRILGGGTLTTAGSDADHVGMKFFRAENIHVDNITFERTDLIGAWFQDAVNWSVTRCTFKDFVNDGLAYGVSADNACQDGRVELNHSYRVRHFFTTANSTDSAGITRRIKIVNNQVWSTTPARAGDGGDAIDTHGGAEDIEILGNTVHSSTGGGINVECASAIVNGNSVYNCANYGIIYHNETDLEGEVQVTANRVMRCGSDGIRMNMPTRGSTALNRSVLVANNRVADVTGVGIYVINSFGSTRMQGVVVNGNSVSGCGSSSASIYLEDVEGATVSNNSVNRPANAAAQLIRIRDCKGFTVSGNTLRHADSATGIGVYVNASSAGSCINGTVIGNTVLGATPSDLKGVVLDNNAQSITVGPNDFSQCNTQFTRGTGSGHDIPADVTQSVTIASDAITIHRNAREVIVDTEASASTDNLATISGGVTGQIICLRSNNSSRDTTVKDGVGNILCGADFTLATGDDVATFVYTSSNHWRRIATATN